MHMYEVLKRPLITEKGNSLASEGQYVFEVDARANKAQIKQAVEGIFDVTVEAVRVINLPAKRRRHPRSRIMGRKARQVVRKPPRKKAIVKVAAGQRIGLFEGV
jgi:large subunit ribosomal protein L23